MTYYFLKKTTDPRILLQPMAGHTHRTAVQPVKLCTRKKRLVQLVSRPAAK